MATQTERVVEMMKQPDKIRNIAICAHIDHGKTTFSDNLLAGAGMISEELAGEQLAMDFWKLEQERGITINAANVSMVHEVDGQDYLINLIDTPGHVDFGGDVTRAMRAVDGTIVLVDVVEGAMPQTETVLRQALKERVKPILFINKVDRTINEMKVTPEKMQEMFVSVIKEVNDIIHAYAPEEFKDYMVKVEDGSVAFGSARNNWAISAPYMKRTGITFKEVFNYLQAGNQEELAKKSPLCKVVLDMVVHHLPNPKVAQKYRIPAIWHGELESDVGKALTGCDPNGKIGMVITKVTVDQHGEVAAGRLFSGRISRGQDVWLNIAKCPAKIQQVSIYKAAQRINVDEVYPGNIIGIVGLKNVTAGETVSEEKIVPFEEIKHSFEPVVTKAIEAKNPKDLPKLITILQQISKEDPTVKIELNEETGEHLVSGLGELHLQIVEYKIQEERGIQIQSSKPIVVYRESCDKPSKTFVGRSPNKHNDFFMAVEPLEEGVQKLLKEGGIAEDKVRKKDTEVRDKLRDAGLSTDESRKVRDIFNGNILVDATRGITQMDEVIELIREAFQTIMKMGPLCNEKCTGVKVKIMDAKLHEDAIHRGPAQVFPAVKQAIRNSMLDGGAYLMEPIQKIRVDCPMDNMGVVSKLVQGRRGQVIDIKQHGTRVAIFVTLPVSESFGFEAEIKSATEGRGSWSMQESFYRKLPKELQEKAVSEIRKRKGLKEQVTEDTGEE